MGAPSILEDAEKAAEDHRIAAYVLEQRFSPERMRLFSRPVVSTKQTPARSERKKLAREEAEAVRMEKWTREFVEGQLLWLEEVRNVKPLRR